MKIIWVHDDALSRDHPVFEAAGPDARAVFVFDADYYRSKGYSLKRLVFIMECVEDMGVEVLEGDLVRTLRGLGASTLHVARSPNPHYRDVMDALRGDLSLNVVKERPFAQLGSDPDLKRFFRYWKKAQKDLFRNA